MKPISFFEWLQDLFHLILMTPLIIYAIIKNKL